jgi:hypothetical protein
MKSVSKSVSMPENLWQTVEGYVVTLPNQDRSSWIRSLVERELERVGLTTADPISMIAIQAAELARAHGADVVAEKLIELATEVARAAGSEPEARAV